MISTWLWRDTRRALWSLALPAGSSVAAAVLAVLDPLVFKWIIDTAIPGRDVRAVVVGAGAFVLVNSLVQALSGYANRGFFAVSQRLAMHIRIRALGHAQNADPLQRDMPRADVAFRIEGDVAALETMLGTWLHPLIRNLIVFTL